MSVYFNDGKTCIDFVLVYNLDKLKDVDGTLLKLHTYLTNILNVGLKVEVDDFSNNDQVHFLKIHAPNNVLESFAEASQIDLLYKYTDYRPPFTTPFKLLATPLTKIVENSEIYQRAIETLSDSQPKTITNCERILIVSKILSCIKFGPSFNDYGYEQLIKDKILESAFALHEPATIYGPQSPLNDRQLLNEYWANLLMVYKEQPLHVIEKYFGTEVGFYFAWIGVYNKMLIIASIASLISIIYGLITYKTNPISEQLCNSAQILCPRCPNCKYESVQSTCNGSYWGHFLENQATFLLTIFMSFWATIFVEMWKRKQAFLKIRWHVKDLEIDITPRQKFLQQTHRWQIIDHFTGDTINQPPKHLLIFRYFLTTAATILLMLLILLTVFSIMVYNLFINDTLSEHKDGQQQLIQNSNFRLTAKFTSSFLSATVIEIVKQFYRKASIFLTNLEYHRTQRQYDKAFIIKWFAIAFVNNFAAVFYIAFFKGRFYTYPSDNKESSFNNKLYGLGTNFCNPNGCIIDLGLQLFAIMTTKTLYRHFKQLRKRLITYYYKYYKLRGYSIDEKTEIEENYFMISTDRYFFVSEYAEMVIQYGFATFFIVGFPIAPILALINNLIELRTDAMKILRNYRRLIPNRVAGLGAWLTIIKLMTYFSVTTNAMTLAFTSQFVERLIYINNYNENLHGFINWTMSVYNIDDFVFENKTITNCYYPGMRYPSEHKREYELTDEYWYVLACRWATIITFEHVVFLLAAIMAYAIPDIPFFVKENIKYREKLKKQTKIANKSK